MGMPEAGRVLGKIRMVPLVDPHGASSKSTGACGFIHGMLRIFDGLFGRPSEGADVLFAIHKGVNEAYTEALVGHTVLGGLDGAANDAVPAFALGLDPGKIVAFVGLSPVLVLFADEAQVLVLEAMVVVVEAEAVEQILLLKHIFNIINIIINNQLKKGAK